MPAERVRNQKITLSDGSVVSAKTVRRCSDFLFSRLTNFNRTILGKTVGTAKVNGYEIPVRRTRGRNGPWIQEGAGRPNIACGYDNTY